MTVGESIHNGLYPQTFRRTIPIAPPEHSAPICTTYFGVIAIFSSAISRWLEQPCWRAALINALQLYPRPKAAGQENSVIIVNERALVGPNSTSQPRGGRLFLPVSAIAQALGDTLSSDPTARTVTVRRQNGTVATVAQLNEVRENGAVVLTVSGTADLIFPPIVNELMLPAEIVAALFDVVVRRDESDTIVISRKGIQVETVRAGAKRAPWEIFQIEYDYNFSRYAGSGDHTLVRRHRPYRRCKAEFHYQLSIGITRNSTRPNLHGGTIRLDRTNGQSFAPGNLVPAQTWNSSPALSAVAWSNCRWTACDSISLAATQPPESRRRRRPIPVSASNFCLSDTTRRSSAQLRRLT